MDPPGAAKRLSQRSQRSQLAPTQSMDFDDAEVGRPNSAIRKERSLSSRIEAAMGTDNLDEMEEAIKWDSNGAKWLVNPRGSYMQFWDTMLICGLLYTSVVTPFDASFLTPELFDAIFFTNLIVDIIFVLDIFITFNLPFVDATTGLWIHSRRRIAQRYFKTWFVIDVVSVFPFDYILQAAYGDQIDASALRAFRLLKLLKLARILRGNRIWMRWRDRIGFNLTRLLMFGYIFFTLLMAHWMACILSVIPSFEGAEVNWQTNYFEGSFGLDLDTISVGTLYIVRFVPCLLGSLLSLSVGRRGTCHSGVVTCTVSFIGTLRYVNKPKVTNLPALLFLFSSSSLSFPAAQTSFYYAVMTITTIGFGDVTPQTDLERSFVTFLMLLGASLQAYLIGAVCGLVAELAQGATEHRIVMNTLNEFMNTYEFEYPMKVRLRKYFSYAYSVKDSNRYQSLVAQMSPNLQNEVNLKVNTIWVRQVPFIELADDEELAGLVSALSSELRVEVYAPFEHVVSLGENIDKLYIISKGLVVLHIHSNPRALDAEQVSNGNMHVRLSVTEDIREELRRGQCFGHELIYTGLKSLYNCTTLQFCELHVLNRERLDLVLMRYPRSKRHIDDWTSGRIETFTTRSTHSTFTEDD